MNKFLATLLIVLNLMSFPSWGADFIKGMSAYLKGDYETAVREWENTEIDYIVNYENEYSQWRDRQ